jgi:fibronectin type 3 domain-containing protein
LTVNIIGFNIYRTDNATKSTKLLNSAPVASNFFKDSFFEFEKSYTYFLRTVSLGKDAEPIESLDSEAVSVTPEDTFPPSPPGAITIAASPQTVSIFFASNPEKDVLGYRVYRSTDPALPKKDWTLMTKEILTTNTFQDTQVESGKTYFYFLTAVDKFGNVSEASEIVSETIP